MSRPDEPVAVVVARTDPSPTAGANLARFADEVGALGEVVLVDSSGRDLDGLDPRVRVIRRPIGRLAPELWRDGLLATEAPLVAFSTAQMIPCRGWPASLVDRLRSAGSAGVGGPIEPGSELSATGRAVALFRYSSYFPPLPDPSRVDPPGDDALYRRDRLMDVASSWAHGFWEVEVHRALRERGEILAMAEDAIVTFEGGVGLTSMIRQRWTHARRYGAGRSVDLGPMARMARGAACPLVPPVLFGRILAALRARGMALGPWLPALPTLAALTSVWAMGEAVGTLRGVGEPRSVDGHESWEGRPSASLSLRERAGVRVVAPPQARETGSPGSHSTGGAPHPGPLPEGEGGRRAARESCRVRSADRLPGGLDEDDGPLSKACKAGSGDRRERCDVPIDPDRSPPKLVDEFQPQEHGN